MKRGQMCNLKTPSVECLGMLPLLMFVTVKYNERRGNLAVFRCDTVYKFAVRLTRGKRK